MWFFCMCLLYFNHMMSSIVCVCCFATHDFFNCMWFHVCIYYILLTWFLQLYVIFWMYLLYFGDMISSILCSFFDHMIFSINFCTLSNILLFLNFLKIILPLTLNVKLVKLQSYNSLHLVFMLTFSVVTLNLKLTYSVRVRN